MTSIITQISEGVYSLKFDHRNREYTVRQTSKGWYAINEDTWNIAFDNIKSFKRICKLIENQVACFS